MRIVFGGQWGDEGKGKIIDWMSSKFDVVVRFQGGRNAGHTLIVSGKRMVLKLLPSGVLHPDTTAVLGSGMVIDPWALLDEIDMLAANGVHLTPLRLQVADNAPLSLPLHTALDRAREEALGERSLGTTKSGIGPTYEDHTARRSLRICDLQDPLRLRLRLRELHRHYCTLLGAYKQRPPALDDLEQRLLRLAPRILPLAKPVWRTLESARVEGKRILFEGAQGALLDLDFGTYPYVTSSRTLPAQAALGSGAGFALRAPITAVFKAYTTRVGKGPFPSEIHTKQGRYLQRKGGEFGSVTGRPRRCGWFDAVLAKQVCAQSGADSLAITKLDVLDGLENPEIVTGYRIGDRTWNYLPSELGLQERAEPITQTLPGWQGTAGVRSWSKLPLDAQRYLRRLEELVGRPIVVVSTGADRMHTIDRS